MAATAALIGAASFQAPSSALARTLVVSTARPTQAAAAANAPRKAPFSTIQSAVNRARPGDWIVITAGVYHGSVLITTPSVHIRGVNRNRVILDGQHEIGNGIEVRADHVSVENLTVRDFDRRAGTSAGGNQIIWNGGLGSGHVGLSGYTGRFLTTYDTGLGGAHGVVIANAIQGKIDDVYASGFTGSGIFIEACRDCQALIDHTTAQDNAIGFSGANAGGHLVLQRSTFRDNAVGIEPTSLSTAALPAPQDGSCYSRYNRSATPLLASTRQSRCTIIRGNLVVHNNNSTVSLQTVIGPRLWGVGIAWPGLYDDLVQSNFIQGNANFGIVGFEAPDPPAPKRPSTLFQVAGNQFSGNTATSNGLLAGGADLALEGGFLGRGAIDNCFTGNHFATSLPAQIETTWGCQNAHTPIGSGALMPRIQALSAQTAVRHPAPQPAPGPQTTLPHPCVGPPPSSACH